MYYCYNLACHASCVSADLAWKFLVSQSLRVSSSILPPLPLLAVSVACFSLLSMSVVGGFWSLCMLDLFLVFLLLQVFFFMRLSLLLPQSHPASPSFVPPSSVCRPPSSLPPPLFVISVGCFSLQSTSVVGGSWWLCLQIFSFPCFAFPDIA